MGKMKAATARVKILEGEVRTAKVELETQMKVQPAYGDLLREVEH